MSLDAAQLAHHSMPMIGLIFKLAGRLSMYPCSDDNNEIAYIPENTVSSESDYQKHAIRYISS